MKAILKGQMRQIMRIRLIHITFWLLALTNIAVAFLTANVNTENPKTASEFLCSGYGAFVGFYMIYLGFAASLSLASDFSDKTLYHELLAGRLRREVYLARLIPAAAVSVPGTLILIALPILVLTAFNGWGDAVPVSAALLRLLLLFFPLLRLFCAVAVISFVTKNPIAGGTCSMLFCMFYMLTNADTGGMLRSGFTKMLADTPYLISAANCGTVMKFESWRTYGIDLHAHMTYYPAISGGTAVLTVVISLVMCAVWLLIGYHYFRTDDLN